MRYKSDVLPSEAYEAISTQDNAVLVDVRTTPELAFVGQPKVSKMATICWQVFPGMAINSNFTEEIKQAGLSPDHDIYFLCRTGGRSAAAATAMAEAGYLNCYNISYGFEGDLNLEGQRGKINGWKAEGLPWSQR